MRKIPKTELELDGELVWRAREKANERRVGGPGSCG